ncbi:MAG: AbrB/MazE/SpoVT family DNA-binding domain-containing protein [Thermoplasmata archaeon]|nr:AbrB/MazE/SpoVT family DNA-binding domain-containing protein [Thermoplasmata archaeon]
MTEMVKIDKFGRILIPNRIRKRLDTEEFELLVKEDRVELIPIRDPLTLFGTLKIRNTKALDEIRGEEHELAA